MAHHSFEDFTPIDSGHIDGARYNSVDRKVSVRFKNGYVYEVQNVHPEDYQAFLDAPSQGEHYHQIFKGQYQIERVK